MEATSEEGGISQSHIFLVSAQEEERGGSNRSSWSWKLQSMNTDLKLCFLRVEMILLLVSYSIYYKNGVVFIVNECEFWRGV